MVQIIVGKKGKGKTKVLINKANEDLAKLNGNIVYLDKSTKQMFELSNKIRLINVTDYFVESADNFIGFVCGLVSQDHDLEKIYLDSFLKLACITEASDSSEIATIIAKLHKISDAFKVDFVLSVSMDESELPESVKSDVVVSL